MVISYPQVGMKSQTEEVLMGKDESWLGKIIKRTKRRPRLKLDKKKTIEAVEDRRKQSRFDDRGGSSDKLSETDYGSFVHISFGKSHLLRHPLAVEVRDPITKRLLRIEVPKVERKRTTGFYRKDGTLIDD